VAICTLKFGGKKHPWVDLKIKGENCKSPLKVGVDTLFYLQCINELKAWICNGHEKIKIKEKREEKIITDS